MVSCNMIGRGKTKTKKFGREELGRPKPCARGNVNGGHIATRQHHNKKDTQMWQKCNEKQHLFLDLFVMDHSTFQIFDID